MKLFLIFSLLQISFASLGSETTRDMNYAKGMNLETVASNKVVSVTVIFKNENHAEHFMTWMSEQGEQDMYTWMQEAQPELAKMPTYDGRRRIINYTKP